MSEIYQEHTSLNTVDNFNIKIVSKESYNGCDLFLHWHSYYEIIYIKEENTKLRLLNQTYDLKPNSIVFLTPNTIHNTMNLNSHRTEEIVCQFTDSFIEFVSLDKNYLHLLTQSIFFAKPYFVNITNEKAKDALFKLLELYPQSKTKRTSSILLNGYLLILFTAIFENIDTDFNINVLNNLQASQAFSISAIKQYLTNKIDEFEPISLEATAKHFGYEATYFSTLFKANFGILFKDYISALKIRKAKKLLLTTDYSIKKISEILNYSSSQNFCRIYQSRTGISPYQYKKLLKISKHI